MPDKNDKNKCSSIKRSGVLYWTASVVNVVRSLGPGLTSSTLHWGWSSWCGSPPLTPQTSGYWCCSPGCCWGSARCSPRRCSPACSRGCCNRSKATGWSWTWRSSRRPDRWPRCSRCQCRWTPPSCHNQHLRRKRETNKDDGRYLKCFSQCWWYCGIFGYTTGGCQTCQPQFKTY